MWIQEVLALSTSSGRGNIGMAVTANPQIGGSMVYFQVLNSRGNWATLATAPASALGTAVQTITGLRSGAKVSVRAVIAGSTSVGTLLGTSVTRTVVVR